MLNDDTFIPSPEQVHSMQKLVDEFIFERYLNFFMPKPKKPKSHRYSLSPEEKAVIDKRREDVVNVAANRLSPARPEVAQVNIADRPLATVGMGQDVSRPVVRRSDFYRRSIRSITETQYDDGTVEKHEVTYNPLSSDRG